MDSATSPDELLWCLTREGACPVTEEMSSSPRDATEKVSCEGGLPDPFFPVDASNPMSDIK